MLGIMVSPSGRPDRHQKFGVACPELLKDVLFCLSAEAAAQAGPPEGPSVGRAIEILMYQSGLTRKQSLVKGHTHKYVAF